MKKSTLVVLLLSSMVVLVVFTMSCSRGDAPMQSTFLAEQGAWFWIQSLGGLNNELLLADSASFARALVFNPTSTVEFWETDTSGSFVEPRWEVNYTIDWEDVDSVRKKVLRYAGGIHAPQTVDFIGRDTLILVDLIVNGYTNTYYRLQ